MNYRREIGMAFEDTPKAFLVKMYLIMEELPIGEPENKCIMHVVPPTATYFRFFYLFFT